MEIVKPVKEYHKVEHRIYSCQYHVIFCPKYRRKVLVDGIEKDLKSICLAKQEKYCYKILEIEVMPDHVHLLIDVDPKIGVHLIISRIKGVTSRLLRKKYPILVSRLPALWTRSAFISSVGSVTLEVVKKYRESQKGV